MRLNSDFFSICKVIYLGEVEQKQWYNTGQITKYESDGIKMKIWFEQILLVVISGQMSQHHVTSNILSLLKRGETCQHLWLSWKNDESAWYPKNVHGVFWPNNDKSWLITDIVS